MRPWPLLVVLAALAPAALAQTQSIAPAFDFEIDIQAGAAPVEDDPEDLIGLNASEPGARYEWRVTFPREYVTAEVRIHAGAFNVTRAMQVVPILDVNESEYPLFEPVYYSDVWNADSPARIANYSTTANGTIVLRLGFTGPWNGTFRLERDVTPPTYTLGNISDITHFSFYQETRTNELAFGDLQVRPTAGGEWVQNPTPAPHFRQRFPVQGLDPVTEYDARVTFTDWAGNSVTTETYRMITRPEPVLPPVIVTPISPAPNATVAAADIKVRAAIDSPSPIPSGGVRLFFDKTELVSGYSFNGTTLEYSPAPLSPGKHSVSVEVTNDAGGRGDARWTFFVEGPGRDAPVPWVAVLVGASLALALLRRKSLG